MMLLQTIFLQLQQAPVPKDLLLPLPIPEPVLVVLLVVSFLVHILFINLMFGGTMLTFFFELKGYLTGNADYDRLSLEIAKTTTVNKSMAVVMGVAPLLTINTLYTMYFYSANALTGLMWIMIIPLVTVAFLLLYAHKYSYKVLQDNKPLHLSILGLAMALFLFIPLIFLTNVNLMLLPEKWAMVRGFVSALMLPNVWPRYAHFLFASLAVTGLFLFWWFGRKGYDWRSKFPNFELPELRKQLYSITFFCSVSQFLIGPVVLLTLPEKGLTWRMISVIVLGAGLSLPALVFIWRAITGPAERIGRRFGWVAICLTITVVCMGSGRHLYRAASLAPHQALVRKKTEAYLAKVAQAKEEARHPSVVAVATTPLAPGETVFQKNCTACHAVNEIVVGPSFKEAAMIYKGNKTALISWIKKPGKKRAGAQMPAQAHLTDQELSDVADWILTLN